MSCDARKPVFGASDQVLYKQGCTTIEELARDSGSGGILCSKKEGADQLHGYCAADPCLCFCICKKQVAHIQ